MTESLDISLQSFVNSCDEGASLYDANAKKHYILTRDTNGFTLSPIGIMMKGNTLYGHPVIKQPYLMIVDLDISCPQLLVLYCKLDSSYLELVIPSSRGLSYKARLKGITHICTLYIGHNKANLIPVVPMLFNYQ